MKKYLVVMMVLIAASCADENLKPIITFDDAIKGAYPRLVADSETGGTLINILTEGDYTASQYGYSVKFIDVNGGADVATYIINVEYVGVNGISQGPVELRTYAASEFTSVGSYKALEGVVIRSTDVTTLFGLNYMDLTPGDKFLVTGVLVMNDGLQHTGRTSSSTVNGAAFQGFFDFTLPVGCPSDLGGTFNYTASNSWCGDAIPDGTVDIVDLGGGVYTFSDFSFGAYGVCYGPGAVADQPSLNFTEVCTVVTMTGFVDSYGDTWTYTIDPIAVGDTEWVMDWVNTYGEAGSVIITNPNGWDFSLNH